MESKAATIDEYLAGVSGDKRVLLDELRRMIRTAAPDAEECISYGVPAFRIGKVIAGFAAAKSHCSYYPFSGRVADALKDELAGYRISLGSGAIHFTLDHPLSESLVRKLIEARMSEDRSR